MPEVLEIEQVETKEAQSFKQALDSWVVEIPTEIIESQDLSKDSKVVLTCQNGVIEAQITSLSPSLKEISQRILEKNHEVYEELKRIGD